MLKVKLHVKNCCCFLALSPVLRKKIVVFDKQGFQKSQSVLVVGLSYVSYSVVIEARFSIGDVLQ